MKLLLLLSFTLSLLIANVDINTANIQKLSTLDGIGASKAQNIIDFRKEHCFKHIKELALVKGIGAKTVQKNLGQLQASPCK